MFGYILDSRPTQEEGEPFRWRYTADHTSLYFIQYQPNDVWRDPWWQIRVHFIQVRDEDEVSEANTEMNAETLYLNEFGDDETDEDELLEAGIEMNVVTLYMNGFGDDETDEDI
jgi:hypothetical protein